MLVHVVPVRTTLSLEYVLLSVLTSAIQQQWALLTSHVL